MCRPARVSCRIVARYDRVLPPRHGQTGRLGSNRDGDTPHSLDLESAVLRPQLVGHGFPPAQIHCRSGTNPRNRNAEMEIFDHARHVLSRDISRIAGDIQRFPARRHHAQPVHHAAPEINRRRLRLVSRWARYLSYAKAKVHALRQRLVVKNEVI